MTDLFKHFFDTSNYRRHRWDFLKDLLSGDAGSWITLGVILAIIIGLNLVRKQFGWNPPSRKERRAARERRKYVLWKYERDPAYDESGAGRDD